MNFNRIKNSLVRISPYGNGKNAQKNVIKIFLIFAIIVAASGFITDLISSMNTPGIDLRNRIVGSRLMIRGLDPYHFKWNTDYPETLLDPLDKPKIPITRTTVPPTTLAFLIPVANLPYKLIRILWCVFQWAALVLCLFIFARSAKSKTESNLIWIIGLMFISGGHAWRLHNALGQIYILYVFLLSLAFLFSKKLNKTGPAIGGFLIGLTASMRFTLVFMGIPFLVFRRWKHLFWSIIGFLSGIAGSVMIAGVGVWESYYSAMRTYGKIRFFWNQFPSGDYPQIIEGTNWAMEYPHFAFGGDSSLYHLCQRILGINIAAYAIPVIFVFSIISIAVLFQYRRKSFPFGLVFQIGVLLSFMSEFLLPARRWSYQDVIWLVLFALVIINAKSLKDLLTPALSLAVCGLLLCIGFNWLKGNNQIMEGIVMLYLTWTTFAFMRRRNES